MQDITPYPTHEDRNAVRYYEMLFEGQDALAAIYLLCTAVQKEECVLEVLETFTDFLSRREEISEDEFYWVYNKENGNLLRVIAGCADLSKA